MSGTGGRDEQVTTGKEECLADDALLKNLLGQASSAMFQAVFAFGLDALQSLNSLSDSDVGGRIYSAGMGPESCQTPSRPSELRENDCSRAGARNKRSQRFCTTYKMSRVG